MLLQLLQYLGPLLEQRFRDCHSKEHSRIACLANTVAKIAFALSGVNQSRLGEYSARLLLFLFQQKNKIPIRRHCKLPQRQMELVVNGASLSIYLSGHGQPWAIQLDFTFADLAQPKAVEVT